MPPLAVQLKAQANLDLTDLFGALASDIVGVDLGGVTFDASGVVGLASGVTGPDLGALRSTVSGALASGGTSLGGVPGASVPPALTDLVTRLGSLRAIVPDVTVPESIGITGLDERVGAFRGAVESGPFADLVGLVPGLAWPDHLARVGGDVGGLVGLLRILAGLAATATTSRQLVERAERLSWLLDGDAALAAGDRLVEVAGDVSLVTAIRQADPDDAPLIGTLAARVAAFEDAVLEMGSMWSAGMGYGEAALPFVDVAGSAVALEAARLAVSGADVDAVAQLVADILRVAAPLLEVLLPDPDAFADGFVAQAAALVTGVTASVESWDVAGALEPVTHATDLVLGPITSFQQALAGVENEVTGALRSLRGIVDELDLSPVADALNDVLQPITDLLDAVEAEIEAAQATLTEIAGNITTALDVVAGLISGAAADLTAALASVNGTLDDLHLRDLADTLTSALRAVATALASAQLSPYFDAAIDVISAAADVIDAVPFGMLPTDVQQEIVDACRPIKELDLQDVEDTLRSDLAAIQDDFRAEVLADIEAAYAEVVAFLQGMDPEPYLVSFEAEALAQVRAALDAIDPQTLLAPVDAALSGIRDLLGGLDLQHEVLDPLQDLFAPVLAAIDALDPADLLAPVQAEVDAMRQSLSDLLHLDSAAEALTAFREQAAGLLGRIDPAGVAEALDSRALAAIAELPAGPPGGAFGSILVSLAEASGLRADEAAVQDVISWVRGDEVGGAVVRARLLAAAGYVASLREVVATLDARPAADAATAYQRALVAAVSTHPVDSLLRTTIEPMLATSATSDVLGTLDGNRRRYQAALDADSGVLTTLAASARGEVTESTARLRIALAPLGVFPTKLREALAAVGIDAQGRSLRQVLLDLFATAGPEGLTPAVVALVVAARAKVLEALDVVVASGLAAVDSVQSLLSLLDLTPIVTELTVLQAQVRAEVAQLSPDVILGGVVSSADDVIRRLHDFDPLSPVRQVLTEARAAGDAVFGSARPTVVFAPVVELHHEVVGIAAGLDVVTLLRPILDALQGIAAQLDDGFDRAGDALQGLQDALPSEVSSSAIGASVDVGVSL